MLYGNDVHVSILHNYASSPTLNCSRIGSQRCQRRRGIIFDRCRARFQKLVHNANVLRLTYQILAKLDEQRRNSISLDAQNPRENLSVSPQSPPIAFAHPTLISDQQRKAPFPRLLEVRSWSKTQEHCEYRWYRSPIIDRQHVLTEKALKIGWAYSSQEYLNKFGCIGKKILKVTIEG